MSRSSGSCRSTVDVYVEGVKRADLCCEHRMSDGTFGAWKAKYSGIIVSEVKRLQALEDRNAKPKKLLPQRMLDMAAMKELLSINGSARRKARVCRASESPVWAAGTADVPDCWGRQEDGALQVATRTGHGAAAPVSRSRRNPVPLPYSCLRTDGGMGHRLRHRATDRPATRDEGSARRAIT